MQIIDNVLTFMVIGFLALQSFADFPDDHWKFDFSTWLDHRKYSPKMPPLLFPSWVMFICFLVLARWGGMILGETLILQIQDILAFLESGSSINPSLILLGGMGAFMLLWLSWHCLSLFYKGCRVDWQGVRVRTEISRCFTSTVTSPRSGTRTVYHVAYTIPLLGIIQHDVSWFTYRRIREGDYAQIRYWPKDPRVFRVEKWLKRAEVKSDNL